MGGATVTMVGRAATNPTVSNGGKGDRVAFRIISTERRLDEATQTWVDGDEYSTNVVCWRQLGLAVLALVRKGDPLVVKGKISTRRLEKDDGAVTWWTEIRADVVGLDVGLAGSRFKRTAAEERATPAPGDATDPAAAGHPEDATGDDDAPFGDGVDGGRVLESVGNGTAF